MDLNIKIFIYFLLLKCLRNQISNNNLDNPA